jgi:hypothetical protein
MGGNYITNARSAQTALLLHKRIVQNGKFSAKNAQFHRLTAADKRLGIRSAVRSVGGNPNAGERRRRARGCTKIKVKWEVGRGTWEGEGRGCTAEKNYAINAINSRLIRLHNHQP